MLRWLLGFVLLGLLARGTFQLTITETAFMKLNSSLADHPDYVPSFEDEESATAAAYDAARKFLYVIGTGGDVLHIIGLQDPNDPILIRKVSYTAHVDGLPDAISLCKTGGDTDFLAVSFEKLNTANKAYVKIYRALHSPIEDLEVIHSRIDLDGVDPTSMAWTNYCSSLVVVQQGRVHVVNSIFEDPEPAIDIISGIYSSAPSRVKVSITNDDLLAANARHVFKRCDDPQPGFVDSTAIQDLEPRVVTIDQDDIAYISFPKNNLVARLILSGPSGPQIAFLGLVTKNWNPLRIDSVADGQINFQNFPIHTFYQPVGVVSFEYNGATYVAAANGGEIMSLTIPRDGCKFDESAPGAEWIKNESFADIGNDIRDVLTQAMEDDTQLGQMRFTTLKARSDFYNAFDGGYEQVTGYGGRSMAIFNIAELRTVYDSGDLMETVYTDSTFPDDYVSIFNAAVGRKDETPASGKDQLSPTTGPTTRAIATGLIGTKRVIVVANGGVGGLYFFTLDTTLPGEPNAPIAHFYRRGGTGLTWETLYDADDDSVGEPETKDIQWIDLGSETEAMIAVMSNKAGAVSFYRLTV